MTSTNGLSRYSFVDVMAFGFKSSEWEDNAWVLGCYRLICFDWLLGSHLESCQNTDLALEAVNKILKSDHSNESFSEAFPGATGLSPVLKQKLCRHVLLSVCHYHPWIRMYRGGKMKVTVLWILASKVQRFLIYPGNISSVSNHSISTANTFHAFSLRIGNELLKSIDWLKLCPSFDKAPQI